MGSVPEFNRRRFVSLTAATFAAGPLGLVNLSNRMEPMSDAMATMRPAGETAPANLRPFKVNIADAELTDLKRRVRATKWPSKELVADDTQGVQLATVQALAGYWATRYDWRRIESRLNSFPQYLTEIDGLDIHFIHVRSKHPKALPVIITHGWPGSIIEQLKVIEPLTNPTAHGGTAADAFDVVIPSLPGHGFSGKPADLGWNPIRIAKAWDLLMKRLGYTRYVAQGGDWGNAVSEVMALQQPAGLLGIHTNMAATVPPEISRALATFSRPADLNPEEARAWDQLVFFYRKGLGYANEMGLRPQTLYALDDSPVGLAAWMLDHDAASQNLIARVFAGASEGLTRDDILDNVTLYWLTNTAVSSARLYWEAFQLPPSGFFDIRGVQLPVGVSAFPDEIYQAPESWTRRAYPKLLHYSRPEKGGHFAAWEQPAVFCDDLRATFRSLR
jgi:pimeloyl-ACP methyl ester carboxylesterase